MKVKFSANKNIFSKMIRWFSNGRVSHAMLEYYDNRWGCDFVAESTIHGVRLVPSENLKNNVTEVFNCIFDLDQFLFKCPDLIGEPYDIKGIEFLAWFFIVLKLLKKKIRKPFHNSNGLFCSEFVARIFIQANLPETETWDPEMITPEMLLEYCERHTELFTEEKEDDRTPTNL
jgi:hypothetical protein